MRILGKQKISNSLHLKMIKIQHQLKAVYIAALSLFIITQVARAQGLVQDVIDKSKSRMNLDLVEKFGDKKQAQDLPIVLPKILSISGLQDNLVAEIVFTNEVIRVQLKNGSFARNWRIVGFDSQSIFFEDKKSRKKLILRAPYQGASVSEFGNYVLSADALTNAQKSVSSTSVPPPMPIRVP